MKFEWPHHPLFNQLCEKSEPMLIQLGFKIFQKVDGRLSFINKEKMTITIQHQGYDMPSVYIGNEKNVKILLSWVPLEFYFDPSTPLFKKHQKLNSFYDFEYDYELIKAYYPKLSEIVNAPKAYEEWIESIDIEAIFDRLKN